MSNIGIAYGNFRSTPSILISMLYVLHFNSMDNILDAVLIKATVISIHVIRSNIYFMLTYTVRSNFHVNYFVMEDGIICRTFITLNGKV